MVHVRYFARGLFVGLFPVGSIVANSGISLSHTPPDFPHFNSNSALHKDLCFKCFPHLCFPLAALSGQPLLPCI